MNRLSPTLLARFEVKYVVDPASGCWLWTGFRYGPDGYGGISNVYVGDWRNVYAHRASWELFRGPIPEGILVLHECDNPPCVNPDHLFLGTTKTNAEDRERKGRGVPGGYQR